MQGIYVGWAILATLFWLMVLSPFGIFPLVLPWAWVRTPAYFFVRLWGRLCLWSMGIWCEIEGQEHFKSSRNFIIIANHRSYLDAYILAAILPRPAKVLGKEEIMRIPVLGWVFGRVGVAVNRSSKRSGLESLLRLREALQQGNDVFVFPEGTFTPPGEKLLPFKNGAFAVALDTQTPLLPTCIEDASRCLPDHSWQLRPGKITVRFLSPISTQGYSRQHLSEVRQQAWQKMHDALQTNTYVLPNS
ncbi:MAG: lysophospholipid acyltransferase family protein [Bernardetiaceae bacterium]